MFSIITNPITQVLIFLYDLFGGNFGLAILALTAIIRTALIPLTLPSLKSAQKIKNLKPHLDKLKKKHTDKRKLQQAQMELYKQHGVNPAAGCLPQILQLVILIALYQVFMKFIGEGSVHGQQVDMNFLWFDLSKPDPFYILPILAAGSQFIFSFMMRPGLEQHQLETKNKKKKAKSEDKLEMAESIQSQMLYMMPIMTGIIALRFPSGLALYWIATTIFSLVQQYFVSGLGGLEVIINKLKTK